MRVVQKTYLHKKTSDISEVFVLRITLKDCRTPESVPTCHQFL